MRIRNAIALAGMAAIAVVAAAPAPTVGAPDAVRSGDGYAVSGEVSFAPAGPQCVTSDADDAFPTTFSDPDVADAIGIDLVDACIEPIAGGLRFTWVMATPLPPSVPPEGVRYNWTFGFADGQTLQLQAKRSNVVSVTTAEDPVGHAQQAATGESWFQVRGACQANYLGTPVQGCYHLDFVEGGIDVDGGRVWMDLDFDPRDQKNLAYAPLFRPGSYLSEAQSASMSIAASGQAGVSNTTTSQYINGWGGYRVGPTVEVGIGSSLADAVWAPAEVTDGHYAGHVPAVGPTAYARACEGLFCTTASKAVGS